MLLTCFSSFFCSKLNSSLNDNKDLSRAKISFVIFAFVFLILVFLKSEFDNCESHTGHLESPFQAQLLLLDSLVFGN